MQAPSDAEPAMRIRLVGDAIRSMIAGDVLGQDYFDFLTPERRAPARALVRDLFERPCGLWLVAPVHYARGFSQLWELTAFPLAGSARSPATVLGLVSPLGTTLTLETVDHDMLRIDRALRLELIPPGP